MARFQNAVTGRLVDVPDSAPTRSDRPGRAAQWAQLLTQMNASTRWTRLPDEETRPKPKRKAAGES